VITKSGYRGIVERDMLRLYVHNEMEEKITLKSGCPFKVKSCLLRSRHWSLNVVNREIQS
jgi:hypothetical protein